MNTMQSLGLVLTILFCNAVQSQKLCDLNNSTCMKKVAQNAFESFRDGIEGSVEPIDPLFVEEIVGEKQSVKVYFSNVTLSGLRNCEVSQIIVDKEKSIFQYDLSCPKLVLDYNFVVKGVLGVLELDGAGLAKATLDKYVIIITGGYEKLISEKDSKLHLKVTNYVLDTDPKGKLVVETKDPLNKDKIISATVLAFINEHWRVVEQKYFKSPIMEAFIDLFVASMNSYLALVPVDVLLSNKD